MNTNVNISGEDYHGVEGLPTPTTHTLSPHTDDELDPLLRKAVSETKEAVDSFQDKIHEKIFTSTVFSTTMMSAFRREYLNVRSNIEAQKFNLQPKNPDKPHWLELREVGLPSGFTARDYSRALEQFMQAIHAPGKYRTFFIVSSDGKEYKIDIGFQSCGRQLCGQSDEELRDISQFVNNFARANWPGLKFEMIDEDTDKDKKVFVNPISSVVGARKEVSGKQVPYKAGIRAITGLPAPRSLDSMQEIGTIDKLTNALHGKKWCYIVIAEPMHNAEIDEIIFKCRDFAGRAESIKSFQIMENISEAFGKNFSKEEMRGQGITNSEHGSSNFRKMLSSSVCGGAKIFPLVFGVLAITCPAFIPLAGIASVQPCIQALIASRDVFDVDKFGRLIKGKTSTENYTKSFTEGISQSISLTKGKSFSENIINKHAEAMGMLLTDQIKRYSLCESLGAWSVGSFFIGENENTADVGANILKSLQSGENSSLEPIRIHNLKPESGFFDLESDPIEALSKFEIPSYSAYFKGTETDDWVKTDDWIKIDHPLGKRFDSLCTVLNTREICHMINFPLANVPGISVRRIPPGTGLCPVSNESGIRLGNQIFQGRESSKYPYYIAPDTLSKHTLVCGISGSGKTNTILSILSSLLDTDSIPFLVIEPAKKEYIGWAVQSNEKILQEYKNKEGDPKKDKRWINIYIPGRETWKGNPLEKLLLNPFDFVWINPETSPKTLEHIDRLKTVVNAALPMQEILPVMMEELIYMLYGIPHSPEGDDTQYPCWLPQSPKERFPAYNENIDIPSFHELAGLIPELFKRHQYAQDVTLNLKVALETRINSFMRGWREELFNRNNPRHSKEEWERLFEHPTVINLTSLTSDEDKAFFISLILLFTYEYRQELSETTTHENTEDSPKLRHLLVIEEAHRILSKCDAASPLAADPKQKVSAMFSNIISEIGAYGQGIMVADQIPCRLNENAIKNTNLKIVHKLVSLDDRKTMSAALNLWDDQERIISELEVGEILARSDMDKESYMIRVQKNK